MKLAVIAQAKVKSGNEQPFIAAANKIIEITKNEPGNKRYEFNQSVSDTTEFAFVELWESDRHLDAHMHSAHMQKFFAEVANLFEAGYPKINKYYPAAESV